MQEEIRYTYDEVEDRVQAYLRGEDDAAERLIEAFHGFLVRWLGVLNGKTAYHDRYHRIFISLFVPHRGRRIRILKGDPRGASEFMFWSQIIRDRYASFTRDDKWNELIVCLLDLATRYNPREGYKQFHTYVMRSFPYYLHRRMEAYAGDLSSFNQITIPISEDPEFDERQEYASPSTTDDIELGPAWIAGSTAGDGFSALTPIDRQILLYYYQDGLRDQEIADRIGLGRCSINRRRLNAVRKLKAILGEKDE